MIISPVKYFLLKPPFLLKGSSETEFVYKIKNLFLNEEDIKELNCLSTYQKIQRVISRGGLLKFEDCANSLFRNNIMMIDSKMPRLLSEVILLCGANGINQTNDIIDMLERIDPLNYLTSNKVKIYSYKLNELVRSICLGLTSKAIWYGEPNLYEHMPIFKRGDEIIYYSDDTKRFLDILLSNSFIEVTDESFIYMNGNYSYLNLKFQIRLKT